MRRSEKIIIRELMLVVRKGVEALEADLERQRTRIRDYESAVQARDETIRTQDAEIARLRVTRADSAKLIRSRLGNAIGEMLDWKNGVSTPDDAARAVAAVLDTIDQEIAVTSAKIGGE